MNYYTLDDANPARIPNTTEVYARLRPFDLRIAGTLLTPGLNAYYDFDRVKGAYVEGLATLRLPVQENRNIYLTGLVGWNMGQSFDDADGTHGYFNTKGMTLVEGSISFPILVSTGSVSSTLTAGYRVPFRIAGTDGKPGSKPGFWVGLNLSAVR